MSAAGTARDLHLVVPTVVMKRRLVSSLFRWPSMVMPARCGCGGDGQVAESTATSARAIKSNRNCMNDNDVLGWVSPPPGGGLLARRREHHGLMRHQRGGGPGGRQSVVTQVVALMGGERLKDGLQIRSAHFLLPEEVFERTSPPRARALESLARIGCDPESRAKLPRLHRGLNGACDVDAKAGSREPTRRSEIPRPGWRSVGVCRVGAVDPGQRAVVIGDGPHFDLAFVGERLLKVSVTGSVMPPSPVTVVVRLALYPYELRARCG